MSRYRTRKDLNELAASIIGEATATLLPKLRGKKTHKITPSKRRSKRSK